ncbi:uncharacterized protein LOC108938840 isoform X2 [Scleropages formosus]|uniref:uncharacterized protein LOC108938840 isoform X2 n=1 Tax=Scleropages formosus TaxID=113540 RepID=UPI00063296E5|nr:uncharacterized protein LOC108938840 isoform X2 [Scleropages formosus]
MNEQLNHELSLDGSEAPLCAKDSTLLSDCDSSPKHRDHPLSSCPLLIYPVSIDRVLPASSVAVKTTVKIAPAAVPAPVQGMSGDDGEAGSHFAPRTPASAASPPEFTHQAIVRLIEAVGRRWDMYGSRERTRLFHSVQQELAEQGHALPMERIRRKWNNLVVTYKRVKDRCRETGQAKTSWEYYEMLDTMLGKTIGAQAATAASATLVGMTTTTKATSSVELPSSSHTVAAAAKPCVFASSLMATSTPIPTLVQSVIPSVPATPNTVSSPLGNADAHHPRRAAGPSRLRVGPRLRIGPSGSAASFSAQQNGPAAKRTTLLRSFLSSQEERAQLEEERLQRAEAREKRREKREIRMADALGRMAAALELVSSKQDTIIALLQRVADKQ